jgi:hypothetical protein
VADSLGDLGLGHVLDEAQLQDQALALVEVGEGAFQGELVVDQLEALVLVADPLRGVAIGCDAREAATVRGARVGGGAEDLDVAIQVEQGRAMIQE